MSDCPVCHDPISAATGQAQMSCGHLFHFRCLVSWFDSRLEGGQEENCPCCRHAAGEMERLPVAAEDASEDEDDDESYEDDEALWLTRADLHDVLLNILGGSGVPDSLWNSFFDEDDEERLVAYHRLPFGRAELEGFAVPQGGRDFREEEWEILEERYGNEDGPGAPAAPPAAPLVFLTRYELEDEVVSPNGGVGVPDHLWTALAGSLEALSALFNRAELDDFLAHEYQMGGGRPLSDERWEALLAAHPAPVLEEPEPAPARLRVRWCRQPDGSWAREVLNPETDEPASWSETSSEAPPDDLVEQTKAAATLFQAAWRGKNIRERIGAARLLLSLSA